MKERKEEEGDIEFYQRLFTIMEQCFLHKEGVAILAESNEEKSLGKFVGADISAVAPLLKFEKENVMFAVPLLMLTIVGEQEEDGAYPHKEFCEDVMIGGVSFYAYMKDLIKLVK